MVLYKQKIVNENKYTYFSSRFDGPADVQWQYWVQRPMEEIQGFVRSHWTPLLGKYSLCISPAATGVTYKTTMMKHTPTLPANLMAMAMRR